MAKHGLGFLEDDLAYAPLASAPPLLLDDDVHDMSTAVAELPPALLEELKTPELRDAEHPLALARTNTTAWLETDDLVDLVDLVEHDPDQAMTMDLDTVMMDLASLPPLAVTDEAPPEAVELLIRYEHGTSHDVAHERGALGALGALGVVAAELARLPRTWVVGGTVLGAAAAGSVVALLCGALVDLFS